MNHLNSPQIQTIVSRILGEPISINHSQPIHHPGTGTIHLLEITGYPKLILKSYPPTLRSLPSQPYFWAIETHNLALIEPLTTFRKPKYYGHSENFFLQELVEGHLFQDLLDAKTLTPAQKSQYFTAAIDELVNIHAAVRHIPDRRHLRQPFLAHRLATNLEKAVARITEVGLPTYQSRGFIINPSWSEALRHLPTEKMIAALGTSAGRDYILGHGDYKPNNLIITPDHHIAAIDWLGMGKAQPWYDLAYLLLNAPTSSQDDLISHYLQRMQQQDHLQATAFTQAKTLLRYGQMYQELARARSNARYVATREDPHHVREFQAALDGLANLS